MTAADLERVADEFVQGATLETAARPSVVPAAVSGWLEFITPICIETCVDPRSIGSTRSVMAVLACQAVSCARPTVRSSSASSHLVMAVELTFRG